MKIDDYITVKEYDPPTHMNIVWDNERFKIDYENRLKADLKAILVELQLQMEEYEPKWVENDEQAVASCRTWEDLDGIIQQKINALEENTDGKID